ncbi:hypothetical protein [Burkholderia oklahomensis]|uniref:hypothetical protein n=1 Tax=Burkholderia oklahomensis TaxID=342113 RepID=UPI00130E1EC5|nr:hypothetical protein [Burkholderia oklahomensis]MBI0363840.1 hypothetical protein [Burkholderia oklahomensis]QPS41857.1 hypothetical protein I6G57_24310 [Burkholderia oklahomensis]
MLLHRIALPMNRLPQVKNKGCDEFWLAWILFRGSSMQRRTHLTVVAHRRRGDADRPIRAAPPIAARTSTASIRDGRIARGRAHPIACPTPRLPRYSPTTHAACGGTAIVQIKHRVHAAALRCNAVATSALRPQQDERAARYFET